MIVRTSSIHYGGPDRLDITVKSGDKTFAPTWDMVMGLKRGVISEAQYRQQYLELMRASYRRHRKRWDVVLAMKECTLVCYCKSGEFCHRLILAEILVKLGAEYGGERS
jgi:uncharacterized protein YeaO (DUF488 family)